MVVRNLRIECGVPRGKLLFKNSNYRRTKKVVIPNVTARCIVVWQERFLSWSNIISSFSFGKKGEEITEQFSKINDEVNKQNERFGMDTDVSSCQQCNSKFSIFKRRKICKGCGLVFCHACLVGDNKNICKSCAILDCSSPIWPWPLHEIPMHLHSFIN